MNELRIVQCSCFYLVEQTVQDGPKFKFLLVEQVVPDGPRLMYFSFQDGQVV